MHHKNILVAVFFCSSTLFATSCASVSRAKKSAKAPTSSAAAQQTAQAREAAVAAVRKIVYDPQLASGALPPLFVELTQLANGIAIDYENFSTSITKSCLEACNKVLARTKKAIEKARKQGHVSQEVRAVQRSVCWRTLKEAFEKAEQAVRTEQLAHKLEKKGKLPEALKAYQKATEAYQTTGAAVSKVVATAKATTQHLANE